jgi:DNA-binding beta-propeller fold protein YncE
LNAIQMVKGTAAAIAVAVGVVLISGCDEECAVCPGNEPISDYDVYIGGSEPGDPILVYNTRRKTITDTLVVPGGLAIVDMAVTVDGRRLLIAVDVGTGTKCYQLTIYDLPTMDTVRTLSGGNRFEVSPSGKYIAIFGDRVDSAAFVDGQTFEPYFSEMRTLVHGRFSINEDRFYAVCNTNEIFIYDMTAKVMDTMLQFDHFPSGPPDSYAAVQPSADEKNVYLLADVGVSYPYHAILSYLPETDTSLLLYWIGLPKGDIRLTPDGNYIIATDPGDVDAGIFGAETVVFLDTRTNAVAAMVPAPYALGNGTFSGVYPGEIAVLPDNRFTLVASESYQAFGMIDNRLHEFVDIEGGPFGHAACRFVACQKALGYQGPKREVRSYEHRPAPYPGISRPYRDD